MTDIVILTGKAGGSSCSGFQVYCVSDKTVAVPSAEYYIYAEDPDEVTKNHISSIKAALDDGCDVVAIECASSGIDSLYYKIACGEGASSPRIIGFSNDKLPLLIKKTKTNCSEIFIESVYQKMTVKHLKADTAHSRTVSGVVREYFNVFMASHSMKYLFSSLVAFLIDYTLLIILNSSLSVVSIASLEISAVIAWCVSSLTNFFLNRNFVFRSSTPLPKAFAEYYGLAGIVFILKTFVILELLTRVVHINLEIAKLFAEVIFYICNYFIQKKFIFKRK
ncbi:MAG: GtrA family protein [Ruminococcaceae bacterium]|nr:GtrA family protein [Oscillospiraceae bacterium]